MFLQNGHSYAFGMRASASSQYTKTTDRLVPLGFGTCNVIKTNKVPDAQGMDTFYLVGKYYGPGRELALPPGVAWGRDVTPIAYPPVPGVTPITRPMVFGDEPVAQGNNPTEAWHEETMTARKKAIKDAVPFILVGGFLLLLVHIHSKTVGRF